jgi:hypothetical protein
MLQLTFVALAILTGALILLRLRWTRLSPKVHRALISCASAILFLDAMILIARISTSSSHLNALFHWLAAASYGLFLLLFTLLRPRWFTAIIAIILFFPILSASTLLPLSQLFNPAPHTVVSLGPNLISDNVPWGTGPVSIAGFDFTIYSTPSWARFLRRRRQGARYFNGQCDAAHASATIQPDGKHALMTCPAYPGQPDTARNLVVQLY